MNLNFILSMGFIPTTLEKSKLNGLPIANKAKDLNVVNFIVNQGIFVHSTNKKICLLCYEKNIVLAILGNTGFTNTIQINQEMVTSDHKILEKIIKIVTKDYLK